MWIRSERACSTRIGGASGGPPMYDVWSISDAVGVSAALEWSSRPVAFSSTLKVATGTFGRKVPLLLPATHGIIPHDELHATSELPLSSACMLSCWTTLPLFFVTSM